MTAETEHLAKAARAHNRAAARLDQTRAQLHAAILAALEAGISRPEIVRITGYTRQRIQQIDLARPPR